MCRRNQRRNNDPNCRVAGSPRIRKARHYWRRWEKRRRELPYAPAESAESIGPMLPLTISDSGSNLVQPKIINASAVGASQPSFHPRNKSTVKVSYNDLTQMPNPRFDVVWWHLSAAICIIKSLCAYQYEIDFSIDSLHGLLCCLISEWLFICCKKDTCISFSGSMQA